MRYFDTDDVEQLLPFNACIPVIRHAMVSFSRDSRVQPLRSVMEVAPDRTFGMMPGTIGDGSYMGAKLVSVYPDSGRHGRQRHRGVVVLFDGVSGEPVCIADAEAVTSIRTAAATAVATEALARADASSLALFGCGTQAGAHIEALTSVRRYARIVVWGRSPDLTRRFAREQSTRLGLDIEAMHDAEAAARSADVLCTLTSSTRPILLGAWISPGAHVNLVGSSVPGPVEVDTALIAQSRLIVDSLPSALAQASELLVSLAEGAITEQHIAGEIGEVLAGDLVGRRSDSEITVYKSLGLTVQDLAAVRYLYEHRDGAAPREAVPSG